MQKTLGNFTSQPNNSFPVDCELFDIIQSNVGLVEILGNIAGDKTVVSGCQLSPDGTWREEGYVFLRTLDHPEGEVLYCQEGDPVSGVYLKEEPVVVTASGYRYENAYTTRSLAPGSGLTGEEEVWRWEQFRYPQTTQQLTEQIAELQAENNALVGEVKMWAGMAVPEGWHLCDGALLAKADYPRLYSALGSAFDDTQDQNSFCLPDLRGRFVVGFYDADADYNAIGNTGGEAQHTLTTSEMPSHDHEYVEAVRTLVHGASGTGGTMWRNEESSLTSCTTESTGSGQPHENRPPYYTLAYIIRIS